MGELLVANGETDSRGSIIEGRACCDVLQKGLHDAPGSYHRGKAQPLGLLACVRWDRIRALALAETDHTMPALPDSLLF